MMRLRKLRWLVALLSLVLVLGACGDDDDGGTRYSDEIRSSYLDGCTIDAPAAVCECTIQEFEKRYTEEEFIAFAIENQDATEIPEEVFEIIIACADTE
jgi:hypothetical protein